MKKIKNNKVLVNRNSKNLNVLCKFVVDNLCYTWDYDQFIENGRTIDNFQYDNSLEITVEEIYDEIAFSKNKKKPEITVKNVLNIIETELVGLHLKPNITVE